MSSNPVYALQANKSRKPIYVTQPHLPPLDEFIPYLEKIWNSKILTNGGPFHQQLEKALCEYLGVEHIALFANGTLALVTALQALRIAGEVITTPYSFVATAHSLRWNGIKPVFVDVAPGTLNLNPENIEPAITPHTTAINGKMSELNAALGLLQLDYIDEALMRRHEIDVHYRELLKDVAGIQCLNDTGEATCNHAYFPILVNEEYPLSRDELYYKLRENNIYARRYFFPLISDLPMYRQERSANCANLPAAKNASLRVLCLPIYPALSQDEQEWIVELIQEGI